MLWIYIYRVRIQGFFGVSRSRSQIQIKIQVFNKQKKDQLKKFGFFEQKIIGRLFLLPGSARFETLIFSPGLYIFLLVSTAGKI